MDGDVRHVRYRKESLHQIKGLYETVMTVASHGLFYRTGQIIGAGIVSEASGRGGDILQSVGQILKDEGWVRDILFNHDIVSVRGSAEVEEGKNRTCHILRGVLARIYDSMELRFHVSATPVAEASARQRFYCLEVECESAGRGRCLFRVETREQPP